MSYLSKIYSDIIDDFTKEEYRNQRVLSRRFVLDNDVVFIAYYNNAKHIKELAIRINYDFNKELISKYPDWNGINVLISKIESGYDQGLYLSFMQLENSDKNIYDAIMEDIIENVKLVKNDRHIINIVGKVLVKWKKFFEVHADLVMSDIRQQGLYSELLFLDKLINMYGDKALNFWSGCNFETHDFYIKGDAIEVKSTSSNNSGVASISNEYQLDLNDVNGELFLMFVSLRKSLSDGETIPSLVESIISKLSSSVSLEIFEDKLFKYGYLLIKPELYKIGFVVREIKYFRVSGEFPVITKNKLPNSIFNVSYKLNLNLCDKFSVLEENLMHKLKEE